MQKTHNPPRSCGLGETKDSKGSSMLSRQEGLPLLLFPSAGGLSCFAVDGWGEKVDKLDGWIDGWTDR